MASLRNGRIAFAEKWWQNDRQDLWGEGAVNMRVRVEKAPESQGFLLV